MTMMILLGENGQVGQKHRNTLREKADTLLVGNV